MNTPTPNTSAREIPYSITSHRTARDLAPQADWHPLRESEHVVQLYEADTFLIQALSEFIGTGLAAGDPCIVIATPEHRAGLDERLQLAGLDLVAARESGQYLTLDAAETLATFMVDGSPEPSRFAAIVEQIVARAAERRRQVWIFGEMVALLWAEGQHDAALRLEAFWNDLHTRHAFVLCCAYPIHGFGGDALAQPLKEVCAAHGRVIPAESYTALATADERLRVISQLQQKAQSLEVEIAERKVVEAALRMVKSDLEVQVADLRRLHELSANLTSTLDIEAVLHEVLQAALLVQETDLGLLSLCDSEGEGLTLQTSRGFDDAFLKEVAWVPVGGGACGTCYAERRRVVVEDVETDPIFAPYRAGARQAGFRAVHSTPLVSRDGTITGVLSVHFRQPHRPSERETRLMDLYARMAADAIENARLYQAAQDAIQVRDQFLSIAAHELKTPLTSLLGNAQLLQRRVAREGTIPASGAKAIGVIVEQARRLNKMILGLLDVSRIEMGRLSIECAPLDLCALVRRVVEESEPTFVNHNVDCLTPSGSLIVDGDEVRLEQVIQNLLSNALKYSPHGGPITVRVEQHGNHARLLVTDRGIGIPKQEQPRLFQRFYRASNADRQYISGMGIGLYVVKEIVGLHGGTIDVESGESAGSTFIVSLPLRGASPAAEDREAAYGSR
ncbi:MAG TPA: ATP-binding protein [Herpetosiphonaceae bacterium]